MSIIDWSTTPASNNSAAPNGWPENMAPSQVNDVGRQMMADLRGGVMMHVDTKSLLSAIAIADVAAGDRVYMKYRTTEGDNGGGVFRVSKSDISANVTIDALGGIYVPFDSDGTGVSGGFIRDFSGHINVLWFGIDGTLAGDTLAHDSACAVLEANGGALYIPGGRTYFFNNMNSFTKSVEIYGDGDGTVIDVTGLTASDEGLYRCSGTQTQIENLSVSPSVGDYQLTFASAPSLAVGDVFQIFNPTVSSWSTARANYYAGEFCEVADIVGNVVTLTNPLYDGYVFSSVNIYKLSLISPVVRNMKIVGKAGFGVLHYEFCSGNIAKNLNLYNENNSLISMVKCFAVSASNIVGHNVGDGGDDYGIAIGNSQDVQINASNLYSRRHAVTMGGDAAVGAVPCRNVRVSNTTLKNMGTLSLYAADMHGNTEDCSYDNCIIFSAVTWQGKNNGYSNCKIYGWAGGVCLETSEIKGGLLYIRNCDLVTYKDPQLTTRGIIDIGGNSVSVSSIMAEDTTFEVSGGTIRGRNMGPSTSIIMMKNRGAIKKINFDIQGLKLDLDNFGSLLFTSVISGIANSDFIILDNITNPLPGKVLANHQAAAYENFPHRCMEESGRETVTVTSGTFFKVGTAVVFHWTYPRIPSISMARTNKGALGARLGIAYGEASGTVSGFTPAISSDDLSNFTTSGNVDLNWTVGIKEI